jgi:hypothetical protein
VIPVCTLFVEAGGAEVIATVSVEELLAALLSPVVATVAVLLMLPVAPTFTATVSAMPEAEVLAASGPGLVQVTT